MRRKKRAPEHQNHERWLVSYADFITLLFAFFVVMFANSQTDKMKASQISDSVKKAIDGKGLSAVAAVIMGGSIDDKGKGSAELRGPGGAQKPAKSDEKSKKVQQSVPPSLQALSKDLQEEIKAGTLKVSMEARGLTISFKQASLFPSGGDEIAPATYASISKVAKIARALNNPIRLEGHTDSVPIHNARFGSNWELSAARSIALLALLSNEFGVPESRLSIAGYADNAPIADNETLSGRAQNRRVDIIFLNETGQKGEPDRYRKESPLK